VVEAEVMLSLEFNRKVDYFWLTQGAIKSIDWRMGFQEKPKKVCLEKKTKHPKSFLGKIFMTL